MPFKGIIMPACVWRHAEKSGYAGEGSENANEKVHSDRYPAVWYVPAYKARGVRGGDVKGYSTKIDVIYGANSIWINDLDVVWFGNTTVGNIAGSESDVMGEVNTYGVWF